MLPRKHGIKKGLRMSIDQVARDLANQAMSRIEQHERVCEERAHESSTWRVAITDKLDSYFTSLNNKLQAIDETVRGIYGRLWITAGAVIAILLSVIGYLVNHHGL